MVGVVVVVVVVVAVGVVVVVGVAVAVAVGVGVAVVVVVVVAVGVAVAVAVGVGVAVAVVVVVAVAVVGMTDQLTDTQQRLDWHARALNTPAHTNDPQTAKDAAADAVNNTTQLWAVLAAINTWPSTADELDLVFAAWPARNAAKRCSQLHTAARGALVKPSGETRTTRNGRQATVWTATEEGHRIANKWHGIHPRQLIEEGLNRHRAGLAAVAERCRCPFDHSVYANPAGLKQHMRRSCAYVEVIQ